MTKNFSIRQNSSILIIRRKGGYVMLFFILLFIGQTELLQNGDLEYWTNYIPDHWIKEDHEFQLYQDSNSVYSGNYSAKFVLRSTETQKLTQIVHPITPGNMYVFKLHVLDNDTMGKIRGYLRFYDSTGTLVAAFYTPYSDDNWPQWELLQTDTFICPQNAETLHVEIRLYDDGSWTSDDSAIMWVDSLSLVDIGPAPEPPYHSISEIQGFATSSPFADSVVQTSGIVTAVFGNNFFIEEYPGGLRKGLYIYRGTASSPQVHVGDSVIVKGTVVEYFGNTQLKNIFGIEIVSQEHPLPDPIELTIEDTVTEDHEGVYVLLTNTECINDSLGYGEWEINYRFKSTTKDTFLHVDDMGVSYKPIVGAHYSILGVITFTYGYFKIEPRDSQDITFLNVMETLKEYKKSTTKTIIWTSNNALIPENYQPCQLFDIFGREIKNQEEISLTRLPQGIYFIKPSRKDALIRVIKK